MGKWILAITTALMMILSTLAGHTVSYASDSNDFDLDDADMSIKEYFEPGKLQSVIDDLIDTYGDETTSYADIGVLNISNGVVNVVDFAFMRAALTNLDT